MSVVILLLFASVLVAAGFLVAFLWAVRRGQYDDLTTPAVRILFDDTHTHQAAQEPPRPTGES
jgi:cbb3-type cytochrome oxidase maturation protein